MKEIQRVQARERYSSTGIGSRLARPSRSLVESQRKAKKEEKEKRKKRKKKKKEERIG